MIYELRLGVILTFVLQLSLQMLNQYNLTLMIICVYLESGFNFIQLIAQIYCQYPNNS